MGVGRKINTNKDAPHMNYVEFIFIVCIVSHKTVQTQIFLAAGAETVP